MPTRMLRDGILTSERIALLAWDAEVFYRRLMSVVDDYGRFYATPMLLRAACYPLQLDKVSDADIGKWLRCAEKAALVSVYPAQDGKRYLELLDFGQRIQSKSKFPPPAGVSPEDLSAGDSSSTVENGESPKVTEKNRLGVVVVGVEDGGVSRKRGKPPKTTLPAGFGVSERVQQWANDKGHANLQSHLECFIGKAKAKAYDYADWDEAFMGAIRDDWAKLRTTQAGAPRQRKPL